MGQIIFALRLRRGAKILLAEWIVLLLRIAFANEGKECSAIPFLSKNEFFDRPSRRFRAGWGFGVLGERET